MSERSEKEREAGGDLNCEVAEKVMGWRLDAEFGAWYQGKDRGTCVCLEEETPDWSRSLWDAFHLVEKMFDAGWRIYIDGPRFEDREWRVMFAKDRVSEWASAATLPLAICVCSLKALDRHSPAEAQLENSPSPSVGPGGERNR